MFRCWRIDIKYCKRRGRVINAILIAAAVARARERGQQFPLRSNQKARANIRGARFRGWEMAPFEKRAASKNNGTVFSAPGSRETIYAATDIPARKHVLLPYLRAASYRAIMAIEASNLRPPTER